ncbi:MAG: ferritin-like domain-containing protein [Planctomycetota bacterium]|jgi:bacterioferritin
MHEKSIELLNQGVADELGAVHQYMYFHFRLDDLGYKPLASMFKRIAIEEMIHVERFAERILFLGGEVEMEAADPVEKIHDALKMLEKAQEMERQAQTDYNHRALECAKNADSGTKKIFEELVDDEERHFELFQTQVEHIERFGEQYLALQSFQDNPMGPPGAAG